MLKNQKKLYRRYHLSGFKSDDKGAIDKQGGTNVILQLNSRKKIT